MTDTDSGAIALTKPSPLTTLLNILTAPGEAFATLERYPTKLFPLAAILLGSMLVMFWYFTIVDFDWYVDDMLASQVNLSEQQLEAARTTLTSMSQGRFALFGVFGSAATILVIYVLQSGYLTLVSALGGDSYRFGHWFSLVCWGNIPTLVSVVGMAVTIALSPNGQLSAYDLNPLTLTNLGVITGNASLQPVLSAISLTIFWTMGLIALGYRQWLRASWRKSLAVVVTPYLLILGTWTYFALA